ncbi:MAG: deoxyribose-phosphate aldolase [Ilumatobacteraceae bacterium]
MAEPGDIAVARRMIAMIDLTDLADDRSPAGIDDLCARAALNGTAAVCVWPDHVARCAAQLAGTRIRIATVVNFPSGDEPIDAVVAKTAHALDDGAHEIDVVMPYRSLLAHRTEDVVALLDATRDATGDRLLKVILETGELPDLDTVRAATRLAIDHGADFVKTSTGKTAVSATVPAVRAMLDVVHEATDVRPVGIKPSGGIRSFDDARGYLAIADDVMGPAWATASTFRFGASGLLDALLTVIDG